MEASQSNNKQSTIALWEPVLLIKLVLKIPDLLHYSSSL